MPAFSGALVCSAMQDFVDAVLVNNQPPSRDLEKELGEGAPLPVKYDPEKIIALGVTPEPHPLLSDSEHLHHDPEALARVIMLWFYGRKGRSKPPRLPSDEPPKATIMAKAEELAGAKSIH